MNMLKRLAGLCVALVAGLAWSGGVFAQANSIETFDVTQQAGNVVVRITTKEPLKSAPPSFTVANPARIVFDFAGTSNALGRNSQDVSQGELRSMNLVQGSDRTRLVLNLRRSVSHEVALDGKSIVVTLSSAAAAPTGAAPGQVSNFAEGRAQHRLGHDCVHQGRHRDDREYQSRYGRYEVRRERLGEADHTTVSLTGGLVAIGGGLYASRAVQSSFALVRVPQVEGVRAYVNRQEAGRTNRNGDLLVPDLLPYYGNLLNIADEDVPLGYDIGRVQQTIAPPHRGGALVLFPVSRLQRVAGRVQLVAEGRVTIPAYGTIAVTSGDRRIDSPVGASGEFYLENLSEGRYPATVTSQGHSCTFELQVPPSDTPVNRVGTVACVASEEQR